MARWMGSWTETAVRTSGLCAGGIACRCGHPRDIADFSHIDEVGHPTNVVLAPSPMPRWCWPSHFMVGTVRILPSQSWQSRGSPANADLNPLQIWIDFVMMYQADINIYIYMNYEGIKKKRFRYQIQHIQLNVTSNLLSLLTCYLGLLPRSKPIHPPEQLGRYDLKLLEARLKDPKWPKFSPFLGSGSMWAVR